MSMTTLPDLVSSLTPSERLDLIELLWDSLSETDAPKLTHAQTAELDSRIDAMNQGELGTVSLEEVLAKSGMAVRLSQAASAELAAAQAGMRQSE
jgi:putative addiction module component (TIGR02574 family)